MQDNLLMSQTDIPTKAAWVITDQRGCLLGMFGSPYFLLPFR